MTDLVRWEFEPGSGPARLLAELAAAGIAWTRAPRLVALCEGDPWSAAGHLLGERPEFLERQPIRPVRGGRSFSSGTMAAPFHSDSQMCLGVPPHVQVMACRRPAERGGECLFLDTWPLLERVEREAPDLFARLFT
ncbi:MAG TPA: TauD/TfdA family dioxygenase, partial [Vicinamibacteria bacterium]|nr:TauD/TfdA family dioxygenase [Vicinamibacteria bacterium]